MLLERPLTELFAASLISVLVVQQVSVLGRIIGMLWQAVRAQLRFLLEKWVLLEVDVYLGGEAR